MKLVGGRGRALPVACGTLALVDEETLECARYVVSSAWLESEMGMPCVCAVVSVELRDAVRTDDLPVKEQAGNGILMGAWGEAS